MAPELSMAFRHCYAGAFPSKRASNQRTSGQAVEKDHGLGVFQFTAVANLSSGRFGATANGARQVQAAEDTLHRE